ncbi:glycosyltransferase family 4 protein [Xinfangfangia sp. CPCC 101601]|uniref:Glycosyltransferase family 4 protein n=1 Tax=Pseudogemmobacter lacusdianii TaxID=3069608 RepID=A0ABU0VYY8_9RHOB|nr:glycosyltransferase family 4 protein [Xinfangfangia sp. CPCC 101601]MDQ2066969.1 glycosyltransferase family 4 protein [Xinfangfangia sp. CPCC 101601]
MQSAASGRTNAAIWYAPDGYDPAGKGINGRRVAGESFLRGFMAHAQVDEFVALTHGPGDAAQFRDFANAQGATKPLRFLRLDALEGLAPVDVVNYPSPNFSREVWRRSGYGDSAYALCGVTHTTATLGVMQGMFDLRAAPQMPWDAVICTSRAVRHSIVTQMDLTDAHLVRRFGGKVPPRPLLPVLPLGIHCADFTTDQGAGAALRAKLGIAEGDIACAIIARLTPEEKFDPLPLYLALARAQQQSKRRFHLLLCGQYRSDAARRVFEEGAQSVMPQVGFHPLDGGDGALRKATLSGADIFLFPIDNVQETFGLAPIEAMAAGLPLIVSDWDGMKDTVTPDVGIRVPTEMPRGDLTAYLGQRYFGGTDSYTQYTSQLSALTRIDIGALTAALLRLGGDPDVRAKMGQAGQRRARQLYDWSVVIPQMQALWAEQSAMLALARKEGAGGRIHPATLPPAPAPGIFFRAYPTRQGADPSRVFRAKPFSDRPDLDRMLDLRGYEGSKRLIDTRTNVAALLAALEALGDAGGTAEELARHAGLSERAATRVLYWLMKYDFAE